MSKIDKTLQRQITIFTGAGKMKTALDNKKLRNRKGAIIEKIKI